MTTNNILKAQQMKQIELRLDLTSQLKLNLESREKRSKISLKNSKPSGIPEISLILTST